MRLVIFLLALFPALNANSKPISAKLSQVKKEIMETRLQISQYEVLENSPRRDAATLKHQNIRYRRKIKRLKRLALLARDKERKLSLQLASLEQDSAFWSASLKDNFRAYLSMVKNDGVSEMTSSLWKEEFLRFSIFNQAAMMKGLGGSAQQTAADKEKTHLINSHLIAQSRRALVQSEQNLSAYQEKRSLIKNADRKKIEAQKKEKRLEESALALTKLLRRLSRASQHRKKNHQAPMTVSIRPHSLPWPTPGVLSSAFGRQKNADLGTWVIHQGIVIETPMKVPVESVAAGRVIFSGHFRSYGRIVILDHGKSFFSIYGHMGTILKKSGERVAQGQIIGTNAPNLRRAGHSLYFELRQGTAALNPTQWLSRQKKSRGN